MITQGRILAVDPGEKRIGIAISDPMELTASPLMVIHHISLKQDCAKISRLAQENDVIRIIVGQALSTDGAETPQVRHAQKVMEALKTMTTIEVMLWDESYSTDTARKIRIEMGASRKKRGGHLDDQAAAVILQSYLDSQVVDG